MSANFDKPQNVDRLSVVLGGNMEQLLPAYSTVPDEFKRDSNKWVQIFHKWFFSGLPKGTRFTMKPGIEADQAIAHLKAIMASFQPKHEHKTAGVAYLMSKWFEDIV